MSPSRALPEPLERLRLAATLTALAWVSVAVGCAPALPSLAGSRTTPTDRADLALGVSGRVPFGSLGEFESVSRLAPGGLAPLAMGRLGLSDSVDLGLAVAGASGRLEVRYGEDLGPVWIVAGLAGYGAYAGSPDALGGVVGDGYRAGALAPLTIGYEVLAILEVWAGLRAGVEYLHGRFGVEERESEAVHLRAGGVVGFALGFRRVHVLAELAVDAEHALGETPSGAFERTGVALTPTLGLRVRL